MTAYLHPLDHTPLALGTDGNLYDNRGQLAFKENAGSYDFAVGADEEKAFHDDLYTLGGWCAGTESLDALDYDALWNQEPGCIHYLHSLGDMHGKRVLLLGNGTSVKEFLFIRLGARLTFTDLSFQGVLYTRARFRASEMGTHTPGACDFHAVNAYCLPFENDLFDLICADAVVHHLDDLKTFFAGIYRCLKPGGLCRFLDTGYASLWQKAKSGVLRRLREFSYTKHPISPEDRLATMRGGYTREELDQLRTQIGFRNVYYQRVALFDYLLWRARCRLDAPWLLAFRPATRGLDRLLAQTPLMARQGIGLVFGFDK